MTRPRCPDLVPAMVNSCPILLRYAFSSSPAGGGAHVPGRSDRQTPSQHCDCLNPEGRSGEPAGAIKALKDAASFARLRSAFHRNDRDVAMKMRVPSRLPPYPAVDSNSAYLGLAAEAIECSVAPAGFVPVRAVRREQRR